MEAPGIEDRVDSRIDINSRQLVNFDEKVTPSISADFRGVDANLAARQNGDDALKTAIKVAVDAGDYERAAKLLDVLKTTPCRSRG